MDDNYRTGSGSGSVNNANRVRSGGNDPEVKETLRLSDETYREEGLMENFPDDRARDSQVGRPEQISPDVAKYIEMKKAMTNNYKLLSDDCIKKADNFRYRSLAQFKPFDRVPPLKFVDRANKIKVMYKREFVRENVYELNLKEFQLT